MSFVDKISSGFKHMCDRYAMDYDVFFRTSNTQHKQNVINIWNTLVEKGIIYKGIYHKRINDNQDYYGNEYLNDDNHSISNDQFTKPIETYYFKLSNFQEKLEKFYEHNQDFIVPKFYLNKVKSFLNNKLMDVSISRNDSTWGIPITNSKDIVYVWFDALIGYLTASNYCGDLFCHNQKIVIGNNVGVHVIGKDILRFHAILWIALLMSLDLPLPRKLLVHGWLLNGVDKISKSLRNYNTLDTSIDAITCDITRYNLINSVRFGYDCEYTPKLVATTIYNLKNTFGEILHRVLSLWKLTNVDKIDTRFVNVDNKLINSMNYNIETLKEIVDRGEFHLYCRVLTETASLINSYINDRKPWANAKYINETLYNCLVSLQKLALMSYPVTPNTSQLIMKRLGQPQIIRDTSFETNQSTFTFLRAEPIKLF